MDYENIDKGNKDNNNDSDDNDDNNDNDGVLKLKGRKHLYILNAIIY